ncbi:MAG TPA: response regulator, partial [Rhodothermia bacterium]
DNEVCYYGSVRVGADGTVFYGTCKGLAIYRPQLDRPNELPPAPQITRFEYREGEWGDNELVVEYAGLSFANERQVRYRTRLVGFDSDWSDPTADHRIRYTNLPAYLTTKRFRFEVQAANDSGVWSIQPARVGVNVLPAWWVRWWAVLIWVSITFGSVVLYVRRKTRIHEAQLAKEREINEQLRRVDKLKDEFLANTSHELRTPLNGIIGIAESLLDGVAGSLNELMRKNLVTVAMSGRRLAGLVNDILDFSKLADRNLELQLKPTSVGVLTDIVLRISEPLLSGKELRLINDVPRDLPPASADEARLQQILINLVGNAVKFTHRGEVTVSAVDAGEMLEISVSDTGIGIPAEKFDAVFEAFEQVDASTAREYGGTGLGLSITKKLVETHGGAIWFDSEMGIGTTFRFTLPKAEGDAQAPEALHSLSHLRVESLKEELEARPESTGQTDGEARANVLVVDDEPVNLQVLANHLSFANYKVAQAMNGKEALDLIDSGEKFDIVLLDIMMPRMSGYEVCERIRQKYLPSELPVIMVTAKNQVSDLVQGLDSGANDYLAKPFSKDELLARLKTHLNLLNINLSYSRFVPREFLRYLNRESILDVKLGDSVEQDMTIFVSDIRSFTTLSEGMTPSENFQFVNDYMAVAGPVIRDHGGFIDRYTGDAIMGLFAEKADDALDAAIDTLRKIRSMNDGRKKDGKPEVRIGIGIHTGSLRLGIVGEHERAQGDIFSDAVNLANRIEGLTKFYGVSVVVTGETLGQLQSPARYRIRFLGHVQVKGKNRPVSLYELFDGDPQPVVERRLKTRADYDAGIQAFLSRDFQAAAVHFERCISVDPDDAATKMYLERSLDFGRTGVPENWTGVEALNFK